MQNQHTRELISPRNAQVQQQSSEWPTVTLTWHACKYKVHKLHHRYILWDVPLVEFMYFVFTRMPGESYRRPLRALLLYLCYVFRELFNSLLCWFNWSRSTILVWKWLSLTEVINKHNSKDLAYCTMKNRKNFIFRWDHVSHPSWMSSLLPVTQGMVIIMSTNRSRQ